MKAYYAIKYVNSDGEDVYLFSPDRGVLYYPCRDLAEIHISEAKRCGSIFDFEIVKFEEPDS